MVTAGTDAHQVSNEARAANDEIIQSDFTYGEVYFQHFIPMLAFAKPQPGEVFWDLGCGAGRPVITASLAYPELSACKGIEFLEPLTDLAR